MVFSRNSILAFGLALVLAAVAPGPASGALIQCSQVPLALPFGPGQFPCYKGTTALTTPPAGGVCYCNCFAGNAAVPNQPKARVNSAAECTDALCLTQPATTAVNGPNCTGAAVGMSTQPSGTLTMPYVSNAAFSTALTNAVIQQNSSACAYYDGVCPTAGIPFYCPAYLAGWTIRQHDTMLASSTCGAINSTLRTFNGQFPPNGVFTGAPLYICNTSLCSAAPAAPGGAPPASSGTPPPPAGSGSTTPTPPGGASPPPLYSAPKSAAGEGPRAVLERVGAVAAAAALAVAATTAVMFAV